MAPKKPVDPNYDGERCGKIRWRLDETEESWTARKKDYLIAKRRREALKPKKKSDLEPYLRLDPATVNMAVSVFGLTRFDVEFYGGSYTENDGLYRLQPRGLRRNATLSPAAADGLGILRTQMKAWVDDTGDLKQSEALCNLQCEHCPRAAALACAAQNISSAAADGFRIDAVFPPLLTQ